MMLNIFGNREKFNLSDVSALALSAVILQLPFYHLYISISIGCWILLTFLAILQHKQKPEFNFTLVLPVLLFTILVMSLFWAENKGAAGFEIERKMSLAIVPFVFSFTHYTKRQIRLVLYSLIFSCLLAMVWLLIQAGLNFHEFKDFNAFFYIYLSPIIHPSYFSYYINIALMVLMFDAFTARLNLFKLRYLYVFLFSFLLLCSFLLMSKNGILTSGLIVLVSAFFLWRKGKRVLVIGTLVCVIFSTFIVYNTSNFVKIRTQELLSSFEEVNEKAYLYSSSLRKVAWDKSVDLIIEKPLIGYGAGDVQDALNRRYEEAGVLQAKNQSLNCHNQFLQEALTTGVFGVSILLIMFIYPIVKIRSRASILGLFCLITLPFFLTESVLQTQAGVVAFIVFYSLFTPVIFNKFAK